MKLRGCTSVSSNVEYMLKDYKPITMGDKWVVPPFNGKITVSDELGTVYGAFNSTCDLRSSFSQCVLCSA